MHTIAYPKAIVPRYTHGDEVNEHQTHVHYITSTDFIGQGSCICGC